MPSRGLSVVIIDQIVSEDRVQWAQQYHDGSNGDEDPWELQGPLFGLSRGENLLGSNLDADGRDLEALVAGQ